MKSGLFGKLIIILVLTVLLCSVVGSVAAGKDNRMGNQGEKERGEISDDDSDDVPGSDYASVAEINLDEVDPLLKQATPYWILLAAGKDEQKALIRFIKSSSASREEKNEWKKVMKSLWKKYPLVVEKKDHRNRLSCKPSPREVLLTEKEQKTLEAIFQEFMKAMEPATKESVPEGGIIVQWAQAPSHTDFIYIAALHEGYTGVLEVFSARAGREAPEPDGWKYDPNYPLPDPRDPNARFWITIPLGKAATSYNHGYFPPRLVFLPNPVFLGEYCVADENAMKYASTARAEYLSHHYESAFDNLGWSSHFMTDVGNPYHTTLTTVPFWLLHDAYETYVSDYWSTPVAGGDGLSFQDYALNAARIDITNPEDATKELAISSNRYADPLTIFCFWNGMTNLMAGRGPHFEESTIIGQITKGRVIETTGYSRGLVRYVTGGQPVVFTITPSAGPHGTIVPSTPVNVPYSGSQTFSITPDNGYEIDEFLVNGNPVFPQTTYPFTNVLKDQTIEVTFKSTAPPEPVSIDVPSYSGGFPQYNVPNYDDELWSVMTSAHGNELGNGLHLLTGNTANEFRTLSRPVFVFRNPLSLVPPGATITGETFVWWVPKTYNTLYPLPFIELTDGSVSDPDEIQASDYQHAGTTVLSDSYPVGWFGGSNPMEIPLNSAGESYIRTTGDPVIFVRFTSDVDGTSPDWSYLARIYLEGFTEAYLHIEYLPP